MTLIPCSECGHNISKQATSCPNCGHPAPSETAPREPGESQLESPPEASAPGFGERLKAALVAGSSWLFGAILVAAGIAAALPPNSLRFVALGLILAGAILLPPTRHWIASRVRVRIPPRFAAVIALTLALATSLFEMINEERSATRASLAADSARRENLRAQFDTGSAATLSRIQSAIDSENYRRAMAVADPYRFIGDRELDSLYALAAHRQRAKDNEVREQQLAAQNRVREQQLVAQVRQVPAADLDENRRLYGQLMRLNPDQPRYRERYNHYDRRLREQEAQSAERRRRFGDPPQASAWDGTYREVKDYLRRVMNDPESLEVDGCTEVYHTPSGWVVGCDYRGRNAFGGMVRQSNWFVLRHGVVVEMKEANAYRP